MKLTKLELSGFKSFADTVTLTFEGGVTAIVGPNGCGKSNVSDAVRWVLGEQSARLLRGGKMEDVIFQGAANRRPVNVTQVSLFLDNSEGELPVAWQEVVITRRLSRSGQSDYLINNTPVRLRDVQDLLRGTGLGSDAGVVIEAKMIDLLLSDRAEERRSLFEEAAGIGLYRNRKQATERRLEETSVDLQRLEDLIAEVQSQIRSLARQKGKTERHAALMQEKFAVHVTLARRLLDELTEQATHLEQRHEELRVELPSVRGRLAEQQQDHEKLASERARAEEHRTALADEVARARLSLEKLEGDLAVAAERLANATTRRLRAEEERQQGEERLQEAVREKELTSTELTEADAEHARIAEELTIRTAAEEAVRARLAEQRSAVRALEQELHALVQLVRSLEGERTALEGELGALRERLAQAESHRAALLTEHERTASRAEEADREATRLAALTRSALEDAERHRHQLAEIREREVHERAARRRAEESVAQLSARRQALEELERDRVGIAPATAALLADRTRFGDAVLGPLSDYVSADRRHAELAERLLGESMHAVLVRDAAAIDAIRSWHESAQPGPLVLLPLTPGPRSGNALPPIDSRLQVQETARAWVAALLDGAEVLDDRGRALRRGIGAVHLLGSGSPTGPLQRRAELQALGEDVGRAEETLQAAVTQLAGTTEALTRAEQDVAASTQQVEQARDAERRGITSRDDLHRVLGHLTRELADADTQRERLIERIGEAEARLAVVDQELSERELADVTLREALSGAQAILATCEADQETAREHRAQWQVQEAHVGARLRTNQERLARVEGAISASRASIESLVRETTELEAISTELELQQTRNQESRAEQRTMLVTRETALAEAESDLTRVSDALTDAERQVGDLRATADLLSEEHHRLEIELTEVAGTRRRILERVETEWKSPLATLEANMVLLDLDRETLETEAERIATSLESIGPVNPLALEEHAEEVNRVTFLTTQRDDLVAARQSLLQAIREIDGTARTMFLDTFTAIQANFHRVFQTLFGGGECDLRLADEGDPLDSEIEIHAAPRGKRTQRIHLLSSGERTLVAVSLLFSIYLTKPSPFCLMDEVDAPLDDANVGRFTTLLDEFKHSTQFLVITHNPRTMQSADAVYGVTMQEPGVSTIVGVRLGEHAAPAGAA